MTLFRYLFIAIICTLAVFPALFGFTISLLADGFFFGWMLYKRWSEKLIKK